jgi:hypothetical protein
MKYYPACIQSITKRILFNKKNTEEWIHLFTNVSTFSYNLNIVLMNTDRIYMFDEGFQKSVYPQLHTQTHTHHACNYVFHVIDLFVVLNIEYVYICHSYIMISLCIVVDTCAHFYNQFFYY